jgi:hypothetical protein
MYLRFVKIAFLEKKIFKKVNNLVVKILTVIIVLVDLYKCIIEYYYDSNSH